MGGCVYQHDERAGAYRGYGATQGMFAMESAVNELAHRPNMGSRRLRPQHRPGQARSRRRHYGERGGQLAAGWMPCPGAGDDGWKEKYPAKTLPNGHVRAVGMALAMQGSGISAVDTGRLEIGPATKEPMWDGDWRATDMGTDAIPFLRRSRRKSLDCPIEIIAAWRGYRPFAV